MGAIPQQQRQRERERRISNKRNFVRVHNAPIYPTLPMILHCQVKRMSNKNRISFCWQEKNLGCCCCLSCILPNISDLSSGNFLPLQKVKEEFSLSLSISCAFFASPYLASSLFLCLLHNYRKQMSLVYNIITSRIRDRITTGSLISLLILRLSFSNFSPSLLVVTLLLLFELQLR